MAIDNHTTIAPVDRFTRTISCEPLTVRASARILLRLGNAAADANFAKRKAIEAEFVFLSDTQTNDCYEALICMTKLRQISSPPVAPNE